MRERTPLPRSVLERLTKYLRPTNIRFIGAGDTDGLKLANFVRRRWPPIKIVANSGFVRVGKDDLPEGSCFLAKPYQPVDVVAALRHMTGAG